MSDKVWFNGKIVPIEEATVSVLDRGFLYGDGIFETMRTYSRRVFRLSAHLNRFFHSAEELRIPVPYRAEEIGHAITSLLKANELQDAYIRLTLSRGVGGRRLSLEGEFHPTTVITARKFTPYPAEFYHKGVTTVTARFHVSPDSPVLRHKSANYLANILARDEAERKGAVEAILVNARDEVAEGAVSNVFVVDGGRAITPPASVGLLPGITRAVILEICADNNIPCLEEAFGLGTLFQADEVFLTNSLMEVMPVASVDDVKIGGRVPGDVTRVLMTAYREKTA